MILCGIKPDEVISKYRSGNLDAIRPRKPATASHKVEMVAQHDTTATVSTVAVEAVYDTHRTGKAAGVYRIYSTNHSAYSAALNGEVPDLRGLKCHWCHANLLSTSSTESGPSGWPAMLATKYWRRGDSHYFEGEGMYCDTRCVEGHRIALTEGGARASFYRDAGPIVRMYHNLLHPDAAGEAIIPRPPFALLREYGGSLSRDEYRGLQYTLRPLAQIVHQPTKYEYETKIS